MSRTRLIPLWGQGGIVIGYAKVDHEDYDAMNQHRWFIHNKRDYAMRRLRSTGQDASRLMHREILGLAPGDPRLSDHINGDGLDNRRANLRIATPAQNAQNRRRRTGASSRFRGVFKCGWSWQGIVVVDGQRHYIGSFETDLEAAIAVDNFRFKHMPFAQPDPALQKVLARSRQLEAA